MKNKHEEQEGANASASESTRHFPYQVSTEPSWPATCVLRVELMEMHMNELDKSSEAPGFFESVAKDEGVQRSVAGVAVAVVVAVAKHALFGSSS